MKRLFVVMLAVVLCLSVLAGCGGTGASSPASVSTADAKKVVAIHMPLAHPYCSAIVKGAKTTLEAKGYEVLVKEGDGTSDGQLADIEDFVVRKVDAVIVFPWDSSAILASLNSCKAAKIPVFVVDNPISNPELVVSEVATDNYRAGVANAEQMIADLGGVGKVVVLDTPENNSSLLRANGFCETLAKQAAEIKIVAQQNYNADQTKAMNLMEDILQVNPDINAVFVCNEPGAFGAYAALEAAGKTNVKLYTVDGSADGIAMVKDGKLTGIAAQQPELMGQTAAEQAMKYFAGEATTASIPLDIMYVTAENADAWAGF